MTSVILTKRADRLQACCRSRINYHIWIDFDRLKCGTQADNGYRDDGNFPALNTDTLSKRQIVGSKKKG